MRGLARNYLLISLGCAGFSTIYEFFSHGVYSYFMILLGLFPLLLGAAPFFLLSRTSTVYPSGHARGTYHAGLATLGTGSCLSGVLEIYGTTSPYLPVYWSVGGILVLAGILQFLLPPRHRVD
jgi:hypothetical protein